MIDFLSWVPDWNEGDDGHALAFADDPDFVPFDGHEVLPRDHPRILARRSVNATPSRPPLIPAKQADRIAVLYERWRFRIGEIAYSRFRKEVTDAMAAHNFLELWNAIDAFWEARMFARDRDRQFMTFNKWTAELPTYVKWGLEPLTRNGKPTARAKRFDAMTQ